VCFPSVDIYWIYIGVRETWGISSSSTINGGNMFQKNGIPDVAEIWGPILWNFILILDHCRLSIRYYCCNILFFFLFLIRSGILKITTIIYWYSIFDNNNHASSRLNLNFHIEIIIKICVFPPLLFWLSRDNRDNNLIII